MRSVKTQRFWAKSGEIRGSSALAVQHAEPDNTFTDGLSSDDWDDDDWDNSELDDDELVGHVGDQPIEGGETHNSEFDEVISALEAENDQLREHLNRVLALLREQPATPTPTATITPTAPTSPAPTAVSHDGVEKRNLSTRAWSPSAEVAKPAVVSESQNFSSSQYTPMSARAVPPTSSTAFTQQPNSSRSERTAQPDRTAQQPRAQQPRVEGSPASISSARLAMTGSHPSNSGTHPSNYRENSVTARELLGTIGVTTQKAVSPTATADSVSNFRLGSVERQLLQLERRIIENERTTSRLLAVISAMVAEVA